MSKHTPGPWAATPSDPAEGVECIWITACPEPNQEKEIAAVYGPQNERNKSTARLIAASPRLLEACKSAEEWLSGWASAEPYIEVIRDAIREAEGPDEVAEQVRSEASQHPNSTDR